MMSEEQALREFLLDIECLDELLPWTEKFNLFDVLKVSRTEIRHSNVLGWMLDPNENHELGDAFLKGILHRLVENDLDGRYDVFKVMLLDMYSFSVYREWKNIDILLVSQKEKVLIAIENKVGSFEHSDQLNRYREILERDYQDYKRLYIFLTPEGERPSDEKNWDVLTYTDIVEIIEDIHKRMELPADISLLVKNYIEIVRRDIVEDRQLIEICNKIYNKHKKALDLIYDNRIDSITQITDIIVRTLKRLNNDGLIIYEPDWILLFETPDMNRLLPHLKTDNGSWGNSDIYRYWVDLREDKFCIVFELGGLNVPVAEMQIMNRIIDCLRPNDKKREDFKYKRVFRTKWYSVKNADNMEEQVYDVICDAVNEIKDMEDKLICHMTI